MWTYHMNYKNNITVIAYADKLFTPTMVNSYEFSLLWFNIAIENYPFVDYLPIKHGDFPVLC